MPSGRSFGQVPFGIPFVLFAASMRLMYMLRLTEATVEEPLPYLGAPVPLLFHSDEILLAFMFITPSRRRPASFSFLKTIRSSAETFSFWSACSR